jgi:hypothetical protein
MENCAMFGNAKVAIVLLGSIQASSYIGGKISKRKNIFKKSPPLNILCPFAAYYLRYAVRSFFTMSRISLAEGKRAG